MAFDKERFGQDLPARKGRVRDASALPPHTARSAFSHGSLPLEQVQTSTFETMHLGQAIQSWPRGLSLATWKAKP
jgi:hypothetical protein